MPPIRRKQRVLAAVFGLLLVGLWWLSIDSGNERPPPADHATLRGPTMGTIYTVRYRPTGPASAPEAVRDAIESMLERIDAEFSTWRDDSQLAAFNRAPANAWVPVSADVITVARRAVALSRQTGGAFDPTLEPVLELWGFAAGGRTGRIPAPAALDAAMALVDYRAVDWRSRPPALRKQKSAMRVNFNALVAGFAADKAAAILEQMGVDDYLVDMGGELRLAGTNPHGEPWRVAVELPASGPRRIERVLRLTDTAVSTSGDYRNYFVHRGKRYSHVLDAHSGWPIEHDVASVTVVAPRAIDADGYATALLALGPEAGPALAERLGLAALFLISDGAGGWRERSTPAFAALETNGRER